MPDGNAPTASILQGPDLAVRSRHCERRDVQALEVAEHSNRAEDGHYPKGPKGGETRPNGNPGGTGCRGIDGVGTGWRRLLAIVAVLGFVLAAQPCDAQHSTLTQEQITAIIASPDRSAADRTNDLRRKPEQMLGFIGIPTGIVAFDLSAAGGYTTELLARAVGPDGKVYGQSRPRDPSRAATPPTAPEGNSNPTIAAPPMPATTPQPSPVALAHRSDNLAKAGIRAAPIVAVVRAFEDPFPPELATDAVDLVTLMFNYHDMGYLGVDRAAMNKAVFSALKPGGMYVIADHSGRAGTGISESGTLHRIEEALLRQEVEAAGFKLAASGDFLRNPNDPRDRNTPDPPQPKDEFVLKFVKP